MNDPNRLPAFGRRAIPPDLAEAPPEASAQPPVHKRSVADEPSDQRSEQRVEQRERTLQSGRLLIEGASEGVDCTIRDLSIGGVGVRTPSMMDLPKALRLLMISEGLLYDCALVWQRDDRAGLRFTGRHDLRADTDVAFQTVRALWKELALR